MLWECFNVLKLFIKIYKSCYDFNTETLDLRILDIFYDYRNMLSNSKVYQKIKSIVQDSYPHCKN